MAAYCRVYDSHHLRLTAKNQDQLWNPTLGNRVWAIFTFFCRKYVAYLLYMFLLMLEILVDY